MTVLITYFVQSYHFLNPSLNSFFQFICFWGGVLFYELKMTNHKFSCMSPFDAHR